MRLPNRPCVHTALRFSLLSISIPPGSVPVCPYLWVDIPPLDSFCPPPKLNIYSSPPELLRQKAPSFPFPCPAGISVSRTFPPVLVTPSHPFFLFSLQNLVGPCLDRLSLLRTCSPTFCVPILSFYFTPGLFPPILPFVCVS